MQSTEQWPSRITRLLQWGAKASLIAAGAWLALAQILGFDLLPPPVPGGIVLLLTAFLVGALIGEIVRPEVHKTIGGRSFYRVRGADIVSSGIYKGRLALVVEMAPDLYSTSDMGTLFAREGAAEHPVALVEVGPTLAAPSRRNSVQMYVVDALSGDRAGLRTPLMDLIQRSARRRLLFVRMTVTADFLSALNAISESEAPSGRNAV